MELTLLRANFNETTVAQLLLNNTLLCVYVGLNKKQGWSPIASLPDGRYSLRKPKKETEQFSLQITFPQSRKPLLMDLRNLKQNELNGYDDAPLYLSIANGPEQISPIAKDNIAKVIAAMQQGDRVHITIRSQYLA